jgi:hypothetical protein
LRSFVQSELILLTTPAPTPNVTCRHAWVLAFELLGAKATIDVAYVASNGVIHFFCARGALCQQDILLI